MNTFSLPALFLSDIDLEIFDGFYAFNHTALLHALGGGDESKFFQDGDENSDAGSSGTQR